MTTTSTRTRAKKPAATVPKPEAGLAVGDAVVLQDGGEALVVGVEDGQVLLRCGTLHDSPHRRPVEVVERVGEGDQTARHRRFRREAVRRGELRAA